MERLVQDLRYGLRGLRHNRGIAVVAALSLGLAIGANTTVFTWMDRFVLQPLPMVSGAHRLVSVNTRGPQDAEWSVSVPALRDWRAGATRLELAGHAFTQLGLREGEHTDRVWALATTDNFFDVLRVRAYLGRTFRPGEEDAQAPVAVLGYSFWKRRFQADSLIIGRDLVLNGRSLTVVGVAAPRFGGAIVGLDFDLYFPLTLRHVLLGSTDPRARRGWQFLDVVGRLTDGASFEQARDELVAVSVRASEAAGSQADRGGALVKRFTDDGPPAVFKPVFVALLGVTGVILLIACANVANLLLSRAAARRREIAVRLAMGATRSRLIRQLLTESLVLALIAGAVGLLVAFWARDLLAAFVPPISAPVNLELRLNPVVLGFALGLSALTALLFGLAPALQASRPELVPALKDEIGTSPMHRGRLQSALLVDTDLSPGRLTGDSLGVPTIRRLLDAVRAVPGVRYASIGDEVPLGFTGGSSSSVEIEGYQPRPDENLSLSLETVGDDYFRAMGIPIVAGRPIEARDLASGAPRVVVVNETFVRRYWPGLDPIGRRVNQGRDWSTVVGVAKAGKYRQLNESPRAFLYHPYSQMVPRDFTVHVHAGGDPEVLVPALRRAFASVSADLPFLDVRTMAEHMEAAVFAQKLGAYMLAAFGMLALVLSAIGIYGVMAYAVSRRTREIGVRVALGAGRGDVVRLVVGGAMRLAVAGLLVGAAAALAAGELLRSQLFGISPRDPLAFATVALLLGAVALVSSWLPARRAARVDPMEALRYE